MNKNITEQLELTSNFLQNSVTIKPTVGIILGTGLGRLAGDIAIQAAVSYSDIPGFPLSTVESHSGKLLFGQLAGHNVVAMQGRFHYYEGYSMEQVTFPVRVMHRLGIKTLVISNAAGSLNPLFKKGSIMLIDDYINLLGTTPLVGRHQPELGPRFPDMSQPYSARLLQLAEQVALSHSIPLRRGVYAAMVGPCLETRAEYRMLRLLGADAIGMSTIPETIVARQIGLETIGISILTDECYPDALAPVTLDEIIEIASTAEPHLSLLVKELLTQI